MVGSEKLLRRRDTRHMVGHSGGLMHGVVQWDEISPSAAAGNTHKSTALGSIGECPN